MTRINYLVVSQDLPVAGQVIHATPDAPYLCLRIDLEPAQIAALMLEIGRPNEPVPAVARGLFTGHTSAALLDATLRLVRLLDTPQDIAALAPLVMREILYRLLSSEHGWRLAQIGMPDSHGQRITRAIAWLRERYRQPLRVDDMARAVHMSTSSLHHHFKAVTAMSPLQYKKQLRLQEARRLLLSEAVDAASAGHRSAGIADCQAHRRRRHRRVRPRATCATRACRTSWPKRPSLVAISSRC